MKYVFYKILFLCTAVFLPFHFALALTITPVRMEASGDPGQMLTGELELYNELSEAKTFYSSADNFEAREESGAPFFLGEKKGLAVWIKTEEKVSLEPLERKTIPYSITIPPDATPGGHFAAILWGTAPPSEGTKDQVAIGGRLGMLIMLKVSGAVMESGGLLEFGPKEKLVLFDSLPIAFTYRFNNTGGDRINLKGDVIIKNIFGFISAVLPANPNANNVLPGSARKFEVLWGEEAASEGKTSWFEKFTETLKKQWSHFAFGRYKAELSLIYGAANISAGANAYVFVFPWQLLSVLLLVLLVVLLLLRAIVKKYNRWIVQTAMRQLKRRSRKK